MANNAFDAYMMFNNGFRKAIVKAPEHAAGTVVDLSLIHIYYCPKN